MDTQALADWLATYRRAWETQDADLFVTLFTPDCEYRDTPYKEPVPGREFHRYWQALARRQKDNRIHFEILGWASRNRAMVNWQATSTRRATGEHREGNGIFMLTFAEDGRCSGVLEWQHWRLVGAPLEKRDFTW